MTHQLALDHLYGVAAILFAGLCGVLPWLILIIARQIADADGLWEFAVQLVMGWTT